MVVDVVAVEVAVVDDMAVVAAVVVMEVAMRATEDAVVAEIAGRRSDMSQSTVYPSVSMLLSRSVTCPNL